MLCLSLQGWSDGRVEASFLVAACTGVRRTGGTEPAEFVWSAPQRAPAHGAFFQRCQSLAQPLSWIFVGRNLRQIPGEAITGTTLSVGLAFGLLVAVFGGLFTQPMLALLGTPADIVADATRYARMVLIAMPGLFVYLRSTAMLRGVGDTVTPLYTLGISTAAGLALTPALIRGWGGLPHMGVASAAAATVVSFTVATLWMGWRLRRIRSPLAPTRAFARHLRIDGKLLKSVLRIGMPIGVQMIVVLISSLVLLLLVNGYGSAATAAYGAVNQGWRMCSFLRCRLRSPRPFWARRPLAPGSKLSPEGG